MLLTSGFGNPPTTKLRLADDARIIPARVEPFFSSPRVRLLCPEDAAAVAELSTQLGYPAGEDEIRQRLRILLQRPNEALFGAERDRGIIAWMHASGCHPLESEPFAEIVGLVAHEDERGNGIGRLLVAAAERWAAQAGYSRVQVRSNVVRERAHRFYERLGYVRRKTSHVFHKALDVARASE
jgi:GNAT superfamily N-acetyltransferase